MATWHDHIAPLQQYDSEHRTVFIVRLAVHFAGCAMIFTGTANHSFLIANRRLLTISLVLIAACMAMEEIHEQQPDPNLRLAKLLCFRIAEACIASLVLLGCLLLRSLTLKETYRVRGIFFLALGTYFLTLVTDNKVKLSYLGNSIIDCTAFFILREFLAAFQNGGSEASNVRALMHLQGLLTVLNFITFFVSLFHSAFGLKLAQYVLQIFAITLFYLFVRPYIEVEAPEKRSDVELLIEQGR